MLSIFKISSIKISKKLGDGNSDAWGIISTDPIRLHGLHGGTLHLSICFLKVHSLRVRWLRRSFRSIPRKASFDHFALKKMQNILLIHSLIRVWRKKSENRCIWIDRSAAQLVINSPVLVELGSTKTEATTTWTQPQREVFFLSWVELSKGGPRPPLFDPFNYGALRKSPWHLHFHCHKMWDN